MRFFLAVLIAVLCSNHSFLAQSTWTREFTLSGHLYPHSLCQRETGFYTLSETINGPIGLNDLVLSSLDDNGELIWAKALGTPFIDSGKNAVVLELSSGNIAVTGYWKSSPSSHRRMFIALFDAFGELLWSITPAMSTGNDSPRDLLELDNGNIIWVGSTVTNSFGATDGFIICLEPNGNILWSKHHGGSQDDHFYSVMQNSSGDIIVAGNSQSYDYVHHGLICRYNETGIILDEKIIMNSELELFFSVEEIQDGSLLLCGYTTSVTPDIRDIWYCKISSDFDLLWSKAIIGPNDDSCTDVAIHEDQFMLFCNTVSYASSGNSDVLCINFSCSTGDLLTARILSMPGDHSLEEVSKTAFRDGNDFVAWSKLNNVGMTSSYLTKSNLSNNESCINIDIDPNIIDLESSILEIELSSSSIPEFVDYPLTTQIISLQNQTACETLCEDSVQIEIIFSECPQDSNAAVLQTNFDQCYWSLNGQQFENVDSVVFSNENPTLIELITNSNGCTYDTTISIIPNVPPPLFDDFIGLSDCENSIIITEQIFDQEFVFIDPPIPYPVAHDTLIVFDISDHCTDAQISVQIDLFETDNFILFNPQSNCDSANLALNVSIPDNYIVLNNQIVNSDTIISETGVYNIQLIDSISKCEEFIQVEVLNFNDLDCDDCQLNLYVPNAFTPNNDGLNDEFGPVLNCNVIDYQLLVFSRWGECIFNATSPSEFWTGKFPHSENCASDGVYTWVLNVNGNISRGHVTLLR